MTNLLNCGIIRILDIDYAKALSDKLRLIENSKPARELKGYWYPSQLGGCDRANVLQHIGAEAIPPDDETLRLFWMGNEIHRVLQTQVPFEVVGHEDDFVMRDEDYHVSGRPDTITKVGGLIEVVEFKSVKPEKLDYPLPDEGHLLQLGCYLTFPIKYSEERLAQTPLFSDLPSATVVPDQGRLVYWSKTDARIVEVVVKPSIQLEYNVKDALSRLEAIYQAYLKDGKLPEAQPKDDWRHTKRNRAKRTYCQYYGTGKCCGDARRE